MKLHLSCPCFLTFSLILTLAAKGGAAEQAVELAGQLPELKFFYYDSGRLEWVVSAEPDRLQKHLELDADSARLFTSLTNSVNEPHDPDGVRTQMARWLDDERSRSREPGSNVIRLRKAEGIVAYLRAHGFRITELVEQLVELTGAARVELAAVHLVDGSGNATFHLKVILPEEQIGMGQQGFHTTFTSPEVSYTSVVYALGVALYEVHEILNSDPATPYNPQPAIEALPPPGLELPTTASGSARGSGTFIPPRPDRPDRVIAPVPISGE